MNISLDIVISLPCKTLCLQPVPNNIIAQVNAVCSLMDKLAGAGKDGKGRYVLCLPSSAMGFTASKNYSIDGVTETLRLFVSNTSKEFKMSMEKYFGNFVDKKGNGILCLLYSCLLTRGLERLVSIARRKIQLNNLMTI